MGAEFARRCLADNRRVGVETPAMRAEALAYWEGVIAMDAETTVVIFRTWRHEPQRGQCVAIFPEIAEDEHGGRCRLFMHVGQHFSGPPSQVIANTQPASPLATALLRYELEREPYGYRLVERKRITGAMTTARLAMAAEYRAMLAREHERSGELDSGESAY